MANSQEITKAIAAHSIWKVRLAEAIHAGQSDTTPERVAPDNLCDFGKWLYSLPPSERNREHWKKVQALHAAFHKEAAKLLKLALSGQKAEAEKCMAFGGSYRKASADLTTAMMAWKKAIES